MVGLLTVTKRVPLRVRPETVCPQGLPLLAVPVPAEGARGLGRTVRALKGQGVRRCLAPAGYGGWERLREAGLAPVDPLPLCRAMGAQLALALVEDLPLRARRVALRGERADAAAALLARRLCPQVGALLLEFDRGGEELAGLLRACYGAPPLYLGQGAPPQVSVELSPRAVSVGDTLRLWGTPQLAGLELAGPLPPPDGVEGLPFLTLLWETGRVSPDQITVRRDLRT